MSPDKENDLYLFDEARRQFKLDDDAIFGGITGFQWIDPKKDELAFQNHCEDYFGDDIVSDGQKAWEEYKEKHSHELEEECWRPWLVSGYHDLLWIELYRIPDGETKYVTFNDKLDEFDIDLDGWWWATK